MKILVSLFILCCAATAIGQEGASRFAPKNNTAENNKSESSGCVAAPHAHRYSDLRMIPIEVQNIDSCGFSYVELETDTVGPDNYLQFSSDFSLSRFSEDNGDSEDIRMIKLARKAVKKGIRGVAIICRHCRTALAMRLFTKETRMVAQP